MSTKKRTNQQKGSARHGQTYTRTKRADGSYLHDYGGGKRVVVAAPKKKAPAKPKVKTPTAKPAAAGNWWDPSKTTARDKSLAKSLDDPLKPMDGNTIVDFAKQIVAAKSAPVQQEYDRQALAANTRHATLSNATAGTSAAMQQSVEQQHAAQMQDRARLQAESVAATNARRASISQAAADAAARMAEDQRIRGGSMDGGVTAAKLAQEQASAQARGDVSDQQWAQRQAADAGASDSLMRQIAAAVAQQGGERQGELSSQHQTQMRDIGQGRARDLAAAQEEYAKTILGLRENNQQLELGQMAIRGDAYEAELKARTESKKTAAAARQKREDRAFTAKMKELDRKAKSKDQATRLAAQAEIARQNRTAAGKRHAASLAAKTKPKSGLSTDQKKRQQKRNDFISSTDTAVSNPKIRAILTRNNMDPMRLDTQLLNRGVRDGLMRNLIIDRHVYGGPRPETVRAYRAKYGVAPPKRWTTKRGS